MGAPCTIKQIKTNTFKDIKNLINSTNNLMNNNGEITLDYSKYKSEKDLQNASDLIENKIENWVSKRFGNDKLSKGWIEKYNKDNKIILKYNFPKYVENTINRSITIQNKREEQQHLIEQTRKKENEDAREVGINEDEIAEDNLYFQYQDDLDSVNDPGEDIKREINNFNNANNFNSYYENQIKLL